MFEIGASEIAVILVIALLVMGPQNLPKVARTIGKVTSQIRRITNEFKNAIDEEVNALEIEELKKKRQTKDASTPPKGEAQKGGPIPKPSEAAPPAPEIQKVDPAADADGMKTFDPYGLGPQGARDPDWTVQEESPKAEPEVRDPEGKAPGEKA